MNPCRRLAHIADVDVSPLVAILDRIEPLFGDGEWRAKMPMSPHKDSDIIVLRGPSGNPSPKEALHSMEVVNHPAVAEFPIFGQILRSLSRIVLRDMARAMIVRLSIGGTVARHTDEGRYAECTARYHLPILTNAESWIEVDGKRLNLEAGKLYWIDKHLPHEAGNPGSTPRTHLVFDGWGRG